MTTMYNIIQIKRSHMIEKLNINNKKIEDLFDFLNNLIKYNYNSATYLMKQCHTEQKAQIDKRVVRLRLYYLY